MIKTHYELAAGMIRVLSKYGSDKHTLAMRTADILDKNNSSFNKKRFLAACKIIERK